jgi:hypothetical protein
VVEVLKVGAVCDLAGPLDYRSSLGYTAPAPECQTATSTVAITTYRPSQEGGSRMTATSQCPFSGCGKFAPTLPAFTTSLLVGGNIRKYAKVRQHSIGR